MKTNRRSRWQWKRKYLNELSNNKELFTILAECEAVIGLLLNCHDTPTRFRNDLWNKIKKARVLLGKLLP
jgi:hypothetical protein